MNTVNIEATDLPDLWFQSLHALVSKGRRFKIDSGSYAGEERIELDYFTANVKYPGAKPLLPNIPHHLGIPNPVDLKYIEGGEGIERSYVEYIMSNNIADNEEYTYGDRLVGSKRSLPNIDQVSQVILSYKVKGHRSNQNIMQVGKIEDLFLMDPPCLRHIDTRIQDNKLHFFIYFRSWEAWAGLPANLAGIQYLKEFMASEIGVLDGEMVVASKGLHIYGHAEEIARIRVGKKT